jgi:hypothetical protein
MHTVKYLSTPISRLIVDATCPMYGRTVDGYTKRSGSPTHYRIVLQGESRPRRIMCLCFSNVASHFVVFKGETLFVTDAMLEEAKSGA